MIKQVSVIVGNSRDLKALKHNKKYKINSKVIAQLALNKMIQQSNDSTIKSFSNKT